MEIYDRMLTSETTRSAIAAIDHYIKQFEKIERTQKTVHVFRDDYNALLKAASKANNGFSPGYLTRNGWRLERYD